MSSSEEETSPVKELASMAHMKDKEKKEKPKKAYRKWLTIKYLMEMILNKRRVGENVPKIRRRRRAEYPC